jgi:hypothetical protein
VSPLRFRKTLNLGLLRLNFTQDGFSSYSVRLGPWSWNSRSRAQRVDLPGPWAWTSGRKRRERR